MFFRIIRVTKFLKQKFYSHIKVFKYSGFAHIRASLECGVFSPKLGKSQTNWAVLVIPTPPRRYLDRNISWDSQGGVPGPTAAAIPQNLLEMEPNPNLLSHTL